MPTLNATAAAGGFPVANPAIQDIGTGTISRPVGTNAIGGDGQNRFAAVFEYATDGYDGHFVSFQNGAAVSDWLAFFVSLIQTNNASPSVP